MDINLSCVSGVIINPRNMRKIKSVIKQLFGDVAVFRLRELKNRVYPNKYYIKEQNDLPKRIAFYSQFVQKNDLCFDVGAHLGNRVNPLLSLSARVIAIEPQESCQKILKAKFGNRIVVVPHGLGAKEEVKEFYISDASYLSSFSKTWIDSVKQKRFRKNNWNTVKEVRVTTLDKLIDTFGKPAFIKIDVEGYELEVLKGLTVPLHMISYEYTTPEQTECAVACLKRIKSISPDIECNYSVGESMSFSLNEFIDVDQMLRFIEAPAFIDTRFGDIYVRTRDTIFHRRRTEREE